MNRPNTLQMPPTDFLVAGETTLIDVNNSVVIIGANGSGKTRLGVWFEFQSSQQRLVRRVGAQKSLEFPNSVSPFALQDAAGALEVGIDTQQFSDNRQSFLGNLSGNKRGNKWGGKPETKLVNDYTQLLVYLISEQYEVSLGYVQSAKIQTIYIAPPDTKIDQVKKIWEQVLPHRDLVLKASTVGVKMKNTPAAQEYDASAMSDGERVAFYLIGQCLAAPSGSIIVIDEPEIHLHRVIQARLWNAIERERPDCLFVYLTHDLEFAASRTEAKKLWIKSYDGSKWDWREVPETEGIPEEVFLSVLGSRKPVLFTEGDRGSFDAALFSRIYPEWTIMPRGGCAQVIEATKAFTALKHLHGMECQGIIDRDYRTDEEIATLLAKGIHVLAVQEIENLLLVENVLREIASHANASAMVSDTAEQIVEKVKAFAFDELTKGQVALVSGRTAWEVEKQLHKIDSGAEGLDALKQAVAKAAALDVASIYERFDQEISRVISERDFATLLRLYNNKGIVKQIGKFFGTQNYSEYVKRLVGGNKGESIIQAMRNACPTLSAPAVQV